MSRRGERPAVQVMRRATRLLIWRFRRIKNAIAHITSTRTMTIAAMAPPEGPDFFAPLVEPATKASAGDVGVIEGMVVLPKMTFGIGGLDISCGVVLGMGEVVVEVREGEGGCDEEDDVVMSEEFVAAGKAESSTGSVMDNPSGANIFTIDVEACTTVVGVGSPMLEADGLVVDDVVCTGVLVVRRGKAPSS